MGGANSKRREVHHHAAIKSQAQIEKEYKLKEKELQQKAEKERKETEHKQSEQEAKRKGEEHEREKTRLHKEHLEEMRQAADDEVKLKKQEADLAARQRREDAEWEEREKTKKCLEEAMDTKASLAIVSDRAKEEFDSFEPWPKVVAEYQLKQHKVTLTYEQLNDPNVISEHVETMFADVPLNFRKELVQMASNTVSIVKSCANLVEVTDCRKQQVSFNVENMAQPMNYSARCTVAFRFVRVTESQAENAGLTSWFQTSSTQQKTLISVAYQAQVGTQPIVPGAMNKSQADELAAMGLL